MNTHYYYMLSFLFLGYVTEGITDCDMQQEIIIDIHVGLSHTLEWQSIGLIDTFMEMEG